MPPIAEDPELVQAFLVESEELLQAVDQDLVKLESAPNEEELLNRTFRALHTIKGTASFLGFEPIVRVGHRAEDVLSVFSGLRPLLSRGARGPTARLSREHEVLASRSGLVTVTGGKWTTYRRMARDAVDRASETAGLAR